MIQIALLARFLDPFGLPFKKALYGPKTQGSPGPYFYTGTFDLYSSKAHWPRFIGPLGHISSSHLACNNKWPLGLSSIAYCGDHWGGVLEITGEGLSPYTWTAPPPHLCGSSTSSLWYVCNNKWPLGLSFISTSLISPSAPLADNCKVSWP